MLPKVLLGLILFIIAGVWWGYQTDFKFIPKPNEEVKDQKYTGPAEKLRIGNIGEYSIFNLIAKEKGFFAENGIDAEIKEYTSGPAAIAGCRQARLILI